MNLYHHHLQFTSTLFFCVQVLTICSQLMDEVMPIERACRDFRSKFPDDVLQENLAGQLWFGAEVCNISIYIVNQTQGSIKNKQIFIFSVPCSRFKHSK